MEEESWEIISRTELAIFGAGVGMLFVLIGISTPGFVVVLDHAKLLFHEAGHVFIGFLINRLEPYGGTIGTKFWGAGNCCLGIRGWPAWLKPSDGSACWRSAFG